MNRFRLRIYVVIAAIVVVVAVGALVARRFLLVDRPQAVPTARPTSAATAVPQPTVASGPIVVLSARPVNTLDPYLMTTILPEESIAAHIWEPLVWLNDDLEIEPRLAESWQLINDFTWELKLRQGVLFHNGESFDARAVKFSLERAQTLRGSLETFADDVNLEEVEILDDHTVRLHIAQPSANLLYQLTSVEMLPPGYYRVDEVVSQPVGSGPYRFQGRDASQGVTLIANEDYWGGAPVIGTLIFASEAEAEQRLAALESGRAHIISDIPPLQFGETDGPGARGVAIESTRRLFVGIRGDEGSPLADARVRQALNYAVDVTSIVQETQAGYGQRYASYVGPPNANSALSPCPHDPDRARELLAEAGYPDGFSTAMDVPIGRYVGGDAIAQAIVDDLAQVNVEIELQYWEWAEFAQRLLRQESSPLFLLAMHSRGNDLEDAQDLAFLSPFNPTGWYNSDFEALLAEASSTYNRERRQNLLWQAQAIAYDEAPWVSLWRLYEFYGVSKDLDWSPRSDRLVYLYQSDAK